MSKKWKDVTWELVRNLPPRVKTSKKLYVLSSNISFLCECFIKLWRYTTKCNIRVFVPLQSHFHTHVYTSTFRTARLLNLIMVDFKKFIFQSKRKINLCAATGVRGHVWGQRSHVGSGLMLDSAEAICQHWAVNLSSVKRAQKCQRLSQTAEQKSQRVNLILTF